MLPEIRRKSISNIADLVPYHDQSTINRAFHTLECGTVEANYLNFLKEVMNNHEALFLGNMGTLIHYGRSILLEGALTKYMLHSRRVQGSTSWFNENYTMKDMGKRPERITEQK